MKKQDSKDMKASEARFLGHALRLGKVVGYKDREGPMKDYGVGLMATPCRNSVEPLAAATDPIRVPA